GQAAYLTSTFGLGQHTIGLIYNGDTNFNTSTFSPGYTHTVGQIATTTGVVQVGTVPTSFGQTATFVATGSPTSATNRTPTGFVQFLVDNVPSGPAQPLNQFGQAAFAINGLTVGPHTIGANYTGDASFLGSSTGGSPLNITINKAGTSTGLT